MRSLTKEQAQNAAEPDRKVGRLWGDSARQNTEGEDQDQGDCRLQVGIFVAMPSRLHTKNRECVGLKLSGSPVRDGLTIGLAELLCIEEDRRSHRKIAS